MRLNWVLLGGVMATCIITASWASASSLSRGEERPSPLATFPVRFELKSLILLSVPIRGAGMALMLVDTGAAVTVVDGLTSDRLGLEAQEGQTRAARGGAGNVELKPLAAPLTLDVGGTSVALERAAITSLSVLRRTLGVPLDGVLGLDFMRHVVLEFDPDTEEMHVFASQGYRPKSSWSAVPVWSVAGGLFALDAALLTPGGVRVVAPFRLDSGATSSLVLAQQFAESRGIPAPAQRRLTTPAVALGQGTLHHVLTRIDALEVGGHRIERPVVSISPRPAHAGLIGGRTLWRFHVGLDFSRNRVFLGRSARLAEADRLVGVGIQLIAEDEGLKRFRVRMVLEGSPADHAGVEVGDRLLKINGRVASESSLGAIRDLLSEEGARVTLHLGRGSRTLDVEVVPKSLL